MEGEEERAVLNVVEVETVDPAREVECADEGSLVGEQSAVNEVGGRAMLYVDIVSETNATLAGNGHTFSVVVDFGELEQRIGMIGKFSHDCVEPFRICTRCNVGRCSFAVRKPKTYLQT